MKDAAGRRGEGREGEGETEEERGKGERIDGLGGEKRQEAH